MRFKFWCAVAALIAAPWAQAAYVTIDEGSLDSIFSQPSFEGRAIDIRIGTVTEIVAPSLLDISTDAEVGQIFGLHTGAANVVNFYFIDTLSACGDINVNYIGCGEWPGNDFVVESAWAASNTIPAGGNISFGTQLLAHELGHNLGLGHRNGNFLMNPFINGFQDLSDDEVDDIFASPLVQFDVANEIYFIQINPVLILDEVTRQVSEPQTLGLLLAGLGLLGMRSRRSRNT